MWCLCQFPHCHDDGDDDNELWCGVCQFPHCHDDDDDDELWCGVCVSFHIAMMMMMTMSCGVVCVSVSTLP